MSDDLFARLELYASVAPEGAQIAMQDAARRIRELGARAAHIEEQATKMAVVKDELATRVRELEVERDEARQLFNKEFNEANESRRRLKTEIERIRALLQTARGALADISNSNDMDPPTMRAKAGRIYLETCPPGQRDD